MNKYVSKTVMLLACSGCFFCAQGSEGEVLSLRDKIGKYKRHLGISQNNYVGSSDGKVLAHFTSDLGVGGALEKKKNFVRYLLSYNSRKKRFIIVIQALEDPLSEKFDKIFFEEVESWNKPAKKAGFVTVYNSNGVGLHDMGFHPKENKIVALLTRKMLPKELWDETLLKKEKILLWEYLKQRKQYTDKMFNFWIINWKDRKILFNKLFEGLNYGGIQWSTDGRRITVTESNEERTKNKIWSFDLDENASVVKPTKTVSKKNTLKDKKTEKGDVLKKDERKETEEKTDEGQSLLNKICSWFW